LIAAITGLPQFSIVRVMSCPRLAKRAPVSASRPLNSPMSAPAMNALSPAPVRMMTLTPGSDSNSLTAAWSSPTVATFMAFSFSGRLTVIQPIPSPRRRIRF
jgi:hypothetical protein